MRLQHLPPPAGHWSGSDKVQSCTEATDGPCRVFCPPQRPSRAQQPVDQMKLSEEEEELTGELLEQHEQMPRRCTASIHRPEFGLESRANVVQILREENEGTCTLEAGQIDYKPCLLSRRAHIARLIFSFCSTMFLHLCGFLEYQCY